MASIASNAHQHQQQHTNGGRNLQRNSGVRIPQDLPLDNMASPGRSNITSNASPPPSPSFQNRKTAAHLSSLIHEKPPPFRPSQRYRRRRWRNSTIAAYMVLAFFIGIGIVFIVFILEQPEGEAPTLDVLEFCDINELEACKLRLRSRLSQGSVSVLRTPTHLIFTFGAFAFVMMVALVAQACTSRRIRKRLSLMPRADIDLWTFGGARSQQQHDAKKCFSYEMYHAVNDEIRRVDYLSKHKVLLPMNNKSSKSDNTWGDTGSKFSNTHFPTNVALSYQSIDDMVSKAYPALKMGPNEPVRTYMERVKDNLSPRIDAAMCDRFVRLYEEAKFGKSSNISSERFTECIEVMQYFYYVLKPRAPRANGRSGVGGISGLRSTSLSGLASNMNGNTFGAATSPANLHRRAHTVHSTTSNGQHANDSRTNRRRVSARVWDGSHPPR